MRAEAKKYEESKREEKARAEGGQSSSDDDDRVARNNILKRQISSSESEGDDNTAKKIKNVNTSFEDKSEETGEEAEEMETIERNEAATEVERKDGGASTHDVQENLIQFDDNPHLTHDCSMNEDQESEKLRTLFITGVTTDITRADPRKIMQQIAGIVGEGTKVAKSRNSLRVTCTSSHNKHKLMMIKTLLTYNVVTSEPYNNKDRRTNANYSREIIFGVDPDITDEEMAEEIGYQVERIIKKKGTSTIRTEQMILYYQHTMPTYVQYGWRRHRVSIYIPEPVRCYKCQEYGHKAHSCRARKYICSICSGPHEVKACPVKDTHRIEKKAVCPNCGGAHPASYRGCPKYKEAQTIKKVQTLDKISYAAAVKKVQNKVTEEMPAPNNNPQAPSGERNLTTENSGESSKEETAGKAADKQAKRVEQSISRKIINPFLHNIIKIMNSAGTKEDIITSLKLTIKTLITIMDEGKTEMNKQRGGEKDDGAKTNHGQQQQ